MDEALGICLDKKENVVLRNFFFLKEKAMCKYHSVRKEYRKILIILRTGELFEKKEHGYEDSAQKIGAVKVKL